MFKNVALTMYPITDLARARRFYEETLALKRSSMRPVCRTALRLVSEGNSIVLHQLKAK